MDRAIVLHLPTMHVFPEEAEEGAFAAYGPRLRQLFVEIMALASKPRWEAMRPREFISLLG